ncbi:chromate efflux transporter [Caulobacter sp. UNC279MFTsu5.1]|uniref:chromate efflux transporter n=1 Tax=Caulobacter sp. UNC279MFTsu5.1 TaxID=1502775 RepID=UPI0008DF8059|nr:chromate efflux transporter [Caulobacter sp. UNC279MFTsu5.1]SFK73705.1 chromate transporter [Caulobacter sp. UNC279MFTsu5.1]
MTTGQPSFREAFWVWLKVGCLGFGGPAGQIALLHREVVERRGWVDEARFAHALSFCMLLPGPEAQQLATWLGWRLHGVRGGIAAGLLFVLPGLAVMLGLSALYVAHGRAAWAGPALLGLKAAVVALVLQALIRMGGRAIKSVAGWWAAGLAFAALTFTLLPFPLIILAAGAVGWVLGGGAVATDPAEAGARTPWRTALVCLAVWLAPVLLALAVAPGSTLARMGGVFSVLAVASFGGAYAALAYVGQAAGAFGWLAPGQMLDGLGLAETTPGPLVLVLVFVGFVGAYQNAPPDLAWIAALAGGLMAAWTTFAPSFLWIFAGGPFFERLRSRPRPARALALVSAAAVGVIANLAVWFTVHLLFRVGAVRVWGPLRAELPDLASVNLPAAGLIVLACGLVFALRAPILAVVGAMVAAGLALGATGLI